MDSAKVMTDQLMDVLAKWRELRIAAFPEKIPNLIWTDAAANMLVGTKSMLSAFP